MYVHVYMFVCECVYVCMYMLVIVYHVCTFVQIVSSKHHLARVRVELKWKHPLAQNCRL